MQLVRTSTQEEDQTRRQVREPIRTGQVTRGRHKVETGIQIEGTNRQRSRGQVNIKATAANIITIIWERLRRSTKRGGQVPIHRPGDIPWHRTNTGRFKLKEAVQQGTIGPLTWRRIGRTRCQESATNVNLSTSSTWLPFNTTIREANTIISEPPIPLT